jgi:hypothetical protein
MTESTAAPAAVPSTAAAGTPLIALDAVSRRYRVADGEVVALADVS